MDVSAPLATRSSLPEVHDRLRPDDGSAEGQGDTSDLSVVAAMLQGMVPWNLIALDNALRASWATDTCSPDDLIRAGWQPDNPGWGHCDITALIVNDIFGGDLMVGEVHLDGEQHGFHCWNRLPSGIELDLTREQFQHGQTITAARSVTRPPGPLPRRREEYLLLRERVAKHLGHLPEPSV
ncbi:hypothetical protein [Streptomyces sp. NPDC059881]|uniref:YunG family protein n=1 Tax=Streptomyces sp. NPDC059881 TaxID=3346986 RepID=UPI00365F808A